jgi:UDP-glucose 4-epimerase
MRVAVTGGAGFIGSHLVERLVSRGDEVSVLDNLSSGKLENLSRVLQRVKFVEGDIRDHMAIRSALEGAEVVVHLAALTSVRESMERPLLYNEVNSTGTLNLLNESMRLGIGKFVYISTCAVYGNPRSLPIKEEHETRPLSVYAASKLSAEEYCRTYSRLGKMGIAILRLFNVYGPRQAAGTYAGVITQFVERVRQGLPPVIYGDGEQTRDFVHVLDVVECILRVMDNETWETINIGSGRGTSIKQLSELVLRIAGKELKPVHEPARPEDIRHSRADVSKARRLLGYMPRIGLEDGLKELMGYAAPAI